jgi:hypothetical protein
MYYPVIYLKGLRITMKNTGQDSWCPGLDLKPKALEYE